VPEEDLLMWLLIATGFMGALTLVFAVRWLARKFGFVHVHATHFSPKGGCQDAVVREIQKARREILVQAYSFTSEPISKALIEAKKRGVHVEILLDHSNEKEPHTDLPLFVEKGLAPLVDANHAIAHNKVMVIDRWTLITGSFNFTNQAEHENAENLLIIKGHGELVTQYRNNFFAHKGHSRVPQAKPVVTQPRIAKAA
jgi:phosphatidylserine/phosphatidylglycerophosphate/cardiolipin synthase-like enzyme